MFILCYNIVVVLFCGFFVRFINKRFFMCVVLVVVLNIVVYLVVKVIKEMLRCK